MARTGVITVSMQELERLKTVQAVVDGFLKPGVAAARLGLTDRQFRRLACRYRAEGPPGLISKRRGKPSNNQLAPDTGEHALSIIRDRYADFGPTLAREKLAECHGLHLAKETVRRLMVGAGIWVPRKQRPPKIYQPRNRRACLGELIQIDGSDHRWFEDRAPACTLLVYVDDATSRIMELRFVRSESAFSYFEATRSYLEQHGKPIAFYSDKASVFRVNKKDAVNGLGHTQYGRALFELNIECICANSSQAKGRVERTHLTLQDRLVKELRLRGISSMKDANAFMPAYIEDHNRRFAKPAKNPHDAHRPLRSDEDLNLIFTWREPRRVSKSLTLQYNKKLYMLADTPNTRYMAGRNIEVYHYPDGWIELWGHGCTLPFTVYDRLSEIDQGAIVENKRLGHVLRMANLVQKKRDNRRSQSMPADGNSTRARSADASLKSARQLDMADISSAVASLSGGKNALLSG